jgi:hypothetical protein
MKAHSTPRPTELVAIFVERNGRDELRFVPTCYGCGKPVLDITQANVAVVGGSAARPKPIGTHKGAKVSRLDGRARVCCWSCDREQKTNNVPWVYAALVFRDRDDAAQQPLNPPFHSVTARRTVAGRVTR